MTDTLEAALVAAQQALPKVEKDGFNPHYKSRFTTLDHLIAKTRPVLNKHGLAILQFAEAVDGEFVLRTVIVHSSGTSRDCGSVPLIGVADMQKLGGAISYARRYGWASVLGISEQEDDDGNQASTPATTEARGGGAATTTAAKAGPSSSQKKADKDAPSETRSAFQAPPETAITDDTKSKLTMTFGRLNAAGRITGEQFVTAARKVGAEGSTPQEMFGHLTEHSAKGLIERLEKLEKNAGKQAA